MKIFIVLTWMAMLIGIRFEYAKGFPNYVESQHSISIRRTDSLWNKISRIESEFSLLSSTLKNLPPTVKDARISQFIDSVWADGVSRWQISTNDEQRYKWFLWITRYQPRFYNSKTSGPDLNKRKLWQNEFAGMSKTYLDFLETKPIYNRERDKLWFDVQKLNGDIDIDKVFYSTTGRKIELSLYKERSLKISRKTVGTDYFRPFTRSLDVIFSNSKSFGLTDESEIRSFLNYLKENGIPELANWASGKERILELKQKSFDYSFKTKDGEIFNIEKNRGKVILVDFWATWCSSCIAKMPMIKEVHEKYRNKGFEVLSISLNKEPEIARVLEIEKRIGAKWPLCIIGDSPLRKEIWQRFAFTSIPQLLLLDKKGRLIENNGELFNKTSLENLVKKALEE